MPNNPNFRDPNLELSVLRFWAEGVGILEKFTWAEIASIPGLAAAIEAVKILPAMIGWDDDEPQANGHGSRAS